ASLRCGHGDQTKRLAALRPRTGRVLHRQRTRRPAVPGIRARTRGRRERDLRAMRPDRVAHPSARSDVDRNGRLRPRAELGWPIEEIRPGDVVWCPPGEKHWHGATPTT